MFDFLRRWLNRTAAPIADKSFGGSLAVAGPTWQDPGRRPGLTRAELEYYRGRPYSAIRAIATRIAGQPIRVGVRSSSRGVRAVKDRAPGFIKNADTGVRLLESHPFLDAVKRPNPYMVGWNLMYSSVAILQLTGLVYWWFEETDDGLMIWPLPPSWVEPVDSEDGTVLFEKYVVRPYNSGNTFELRGEDVLRFYLADPANPVRGCLAPLLAAALSVSADESILQSQARAFQNGIFPGTAVIVGRHPDAQGVPGQRPVLTKDQRNQLINAIKQGYAGAIKAGEPIILDGLINDIKRVTESVREMDYGDSSLMTRDRIDQCFGVPPIVLGLIQDANRAGAAVADEIFIGNTINPLIELLSQTMTHFAQERFDDRLLAFIEPARVIDPDGDRANRQQLIQAGCLKKNELRTMMHLPELSRDEGGDDLIEPVSAGSSAPQDTDGGTAGFAGGIFRRVG